MPPAPSPDRFARRTPFWDARALEYRESLARTTDLAHIEDPAVRDALFQDPLVAVALAGNPTLTDAVAPQVIAAWSSTWIHDQGRFDSLGTAIRTWEDRVGHLSPAVCAAFEQAMPSQDAAGHQGWGEHLIRATRSPWSAWVFMRVVRFVHAANRPRWMTNLSDDDVFRCWASNPSLSAEARRTFLLTEAREACAFISKRAMFTRWCEEVVLWPEMQQDAPTFWVTMANILGCDDLLVAAAQSLSDTVDARRAFLAAMVDLAAPDVEGRRTVDLLWKLAPFLIDWAASDPELMAVTQPHPAATVRMWGVLNLAPPASGSRRPTSPATAVRPSVG